MSKEKVVLAYSGGLDTSVCVKWLQDEKKKRAKEDDPFARLPNKGPIIDKLPSATDGCWDDEPF